MFRGGIHPRVCCYPLPFLSLSTVRPAAPCPACTRGSHPQPLRPRRIPRAVPARPSRHALWWKPGRRPRLCWSAAHLPAANGAGLSKYPPAEPGALRALAPQRGL